MLQTFAQAGCGFDIVSGGELDACWPPAATPDKGGVLRRRQDTRRDGARSRPACLPSNVESRERDRNCSGGGRAAAGAPISPARQPDVDPKTHPYISTGLKGNKFGIAHEACAVPPPACREPAGIAVAGIDCHIGSQITESRPYLDALDRVLDLVKRWKPRYRSLHHLDLGGGLGITYTDEQPPAAEALVQAMLLARIDTARPRPPQDPASSLAARWSATPACWLPACCT